MTNPRLPDTGEQARLAVTRLIWGGMLAGLVTFTAVVMIVGAGGAIQPDTSLAMLLTLASAGVLVMSTTAGALVRRMVYNRARSGPDGSVAPAAYLQGNIIFLAACECPALLSLAAALLGGGLWPWALPAAVAVAIMALNFPTGAAMRPGPYSR